MDHSIMKVVGVKMLFKLIIIIISLLYVSIADSVLSNCEVPLNSSSCGMRPTTVYTFYSDMEFCLPAIWRGCPTANKFDHAHECVAFCTEHRGVYGLASKLRLNIKPVRCDVPLNTTRCTNETKHIYTFNNEKEACVEAEWFGCPTENIFPDVSSCQDNCQNSWNEELDRMEKNLTTELCATPLNTSRCSDKFEKLVYTFDIEKGACAEALWFGCPTNNIFTDISSCQDSCSEIWYKEWKRVDTYKEKSALYVPKTLNKKIDEPKKANNPDGSDAKTKACSALLNTNRCTKYVKQVYTYSNEKGACVKALWFGCPSENLFTDIRSCQRNCHVIVDKVTTTDMPKTKTKKFIDYNEKAYFIYKLRDANKGAGERIDDVDIMLLSQDKYNLL